MAFKRRAIMLSWEVRRKKEKKKNHKAVSKSCMHTYMYMQKTKISLALNGWHES